MLCLTGRVLGGGQINGIVQAQTGTPCSVGKNNDYAGVGNDGSLGCSNNGIGQFWVKNGNVDYQGNSDPTGGTSASTQYWFKTTNSDGTPIFTAPPTGTFNLQPGIRNTIYHPGFNNVNLGLFKKIPITERIGFQFRAEAFNAFNKDNLSPVNLDPTNAVTFGKVTTRLNDPTRDARNLQLSLRLYF